MELLNQFELENIQGEGFLSGLCSGFAAGAGVAGGLNALASYGVIAAIPGLGTGLAVGLVGTAVACSASFWFD